MSSSGAAFARRFVSLDAVAWRPEVFSRETPEDALIAREEEIGDEDAEAVEARNLAIRAISAAKLEGYLKQLPSTEAIALALDLGLLGYPPTPQSEIAETLGLASQQIVSYLVHRAKTRLLYLASRPQIDVAVLARALPPVKLEIVREVYETASFAEVARRRWTCPEDRTGPRRRAWMHVHATKIKRDFFRALAKIEKRPELAEQVAALRHLVSSLGALSRHAGKGSWKRAHADAPPPTPTES